MNKTLLLPLPLLLGLTVGCRHDAAGPLDARPAALVTVDVQAPQQVALPRTTTQPAAVHAFFEARLLAKASGYVSQPPADIGQAVQKGDLLAQLDVPEMDQQRLAQLARVQQRLADQQRVEAQLAVAQARAASQAAKLDQVRAEVASAEASLAAAAAELERVTDLVEQKAVAKRLLDESQQKHEAAAASKSAAQAAVASAQADVALADAQIDAARADVKVAEANTEVARRELDELDARLAYTRITAPFDGVVTQRHVELGDLVRNAQIGADSGAQPLFVLTQVDPVRIRVAVPERDAPMVSVRDPAQITLQALPGEVFPGEVSRLAGALDEKTRTMLVEIDLPNAEGRLLPGMFGEATITLEPPAEKLALPAGAVHFDEQGESHVYVVNSSSKVEVVPVQTGLDDGRQIEITAGLTAQDRVVGPLLRRLKAGQEVQVREPAAGVQAGG